MLLTILAHVVAEGATRPHGMPAAINLPVQSCDWAANLCHD